MKNAVELARAASNANWRRFKEAEQALYRLMLRLDVEESIETVLATDEWKAAAHILGWDIDWAEVAR